MSACSQPLDLFARELDNDAALLGLPLGDSGVSEALGLHKNTRPIAAPENSFSVSNGDVEQSIPVFDLWRVFQEKRGISKHKNPLGFKATEQAGNRDISADSGNPLISLNSAKFVPFLPTVAAGRQTDLPKELAA